MIYLLSAINTFIFSSLSALHFYWAFGGKWGYQAVLPSQKDGTPTLQPNTFATIMVAIFLLSFAFISSANWGLYTWVDRDMIYYCHLLLALLFTWRAIGDFKMIGFTKKIKGTPFAENDTKIYSPLCLIIGLFCACILLLR